MRTDLKRILHEGGLQFSICCIHSFTGHLARFSEFTLSAMLPAKGFREEDERTLNKTSSLKGFMAKFRLM